MFPFGSNGNLVGMNVNLRQLRAFVAGVRATSFSEAAERLGITQPGFSLLIRQLEVELGLKLFDRTTRRVEVTLEGREFARKVEQILEDLDSACRDMEDRKSLRRGRVRIGLLPSAGAMILPPLLSRLSAEMPEIEISVVEHLAEPLQESVEREMVDFGIGMNPRNTPGLRFVPILEDRLICLCAKSDPIATMEAPTWDDLCARPFIGFTGNTSIDHQVRALLTEAGTSFVRRSEISGLNTAVGLVRAGLGITLIPELGLGGLDLTGLGLRAVDSRTARRQIGLIMLRRRTRSPATLAVIDVFERSAAAAAAEVLAQFRDLPRIRLPEGTGA